MRTNPPRASETALASVNLRLPLANLPDGEIAARSPGERSGPRPIDQFPVIVDLTQYVTIPLAATLTGYSPKAIRRKIESGIWLDGREYRKAPDGHVLISMKGYQQWVERGRV